MRAKRAGLHAEDARIAGRERGVVQQLPRIEPALLPIAQHLLTGQYSHTHGVESNGGANGGGGRHRAAQRVQR